MIRTLINIHKSNSAWKIQLHRNKMKSTVLSLRSLFFSQSLLISFSFISTVSFTFAVPLFFVTFKSFLQKQEIRGDDNDPL